MLQLKQARTIWEQLLAVSFLSQQIKEKYFSVLDDRFLTLYGELRIEISGTVPRSCQNILPVIWQPIMIVKSRFVVPI